MTIQTLSYKELHRILKNQYLRDFPPSERKPYTTIMWLRLRGCYCGYGLYQDGSLAAYALVMQNQNDALLDYFAVEPQLRGRGVGTTALGVLCDHLQSRGRTVLAEIELEEQGDTPDITSQKQSRRRFYQNCGWQLSGAKVYLFDVNYQIIAKSSAHLSDAELRERVDAFYRRSIIAPVYRQKVFWRS